MTALHTACNHDKIDAVRCLVVDISSEHINRASSENSFTALHYAAQVQWNFEQQHFDHNFSPCFLRNINLVIYLKVKP